QTFNANVQRAFHYGLVAFHAEAAFEELGGRVVDKRERRVDDYVKWSRRSLSFSELLGRVMGEVFNLVFNYGELNRQADLRRGESNAGRFAHRLAHQFN